MSILRELRRRNVFKVGIAYIVVAWLLLQVADVILNNVTAPGWIFQVILLVLAIGLPLILLFAWAFELTPEGLKREHEVDRDESITTHTGKKLNRVIIGVLVLALAYFAYDKFQSRSQELFAPVALEPLKNEQGTTVAEQADAKSIAVLPFVDMSAEKDQEYLSDGISEELLNVLAKVPELKVTSRSTAFFYKGKDFKISDIGRELNVAHVLEGSVRKSGNRVRITAQLIDVDSDTHLWSESYDRTLDDIFAVQDEIANEVVSELKVEILG